MPTRRTVLSTLAGTAAASALSRFALPQTPAASAPRETSPHDPLRPAFHYLPARNWMNDPCAPTFYRGQYHMFHQYNPHSAVWGDMHWAHATSPDMIHWRRQPVALSPTPGGPDSEGCFTGSALRLPDGTPAIIYTGVQSVPHDQATLSDGTHNFRETQLLATAADPALATWQKHGDPVIPSPPPGMQVTGFRDPCPFSYAGHQYLIVGSGIARKGGMALLYRAISPDLTSWRYLHPLIQDKSWSNPVSTLDEAHPDPVSTGEMWECPDFFRLGTRHVLIYSTRRKTYWQVGDLNPRSLTFHPTASGQLDFGRSFYAPKTQLDDHGDRILWGWLAETRPEADFAAAGWSGMLSLPRVLSIREGRLSMQPIADLDSLRLPSPPPSAPLNEFDAVIVAQSPGSAPVPPFTLADSHGPLLHIVTSSNSANITFNNAVLESPTPLSPSAPLQVYFDNSVLELFLDHRLCITHRFYHRSAERPIATLHLPFPHTVTYPRQYTFSSIWKP